jgi:hypothetical protein
MIPAVQSVVQRDEFLPGLRPGPRRTGRSRHRRHQKAGHAQPPPSLAHDAFHVVIVDAAWRARQVAE